MTPLSRRDTLKLVGATLGGMLLASCLPAAVSGPKKPTQTSGVGPGAAKATVTPVASASDSLPRKAEVLVLGAGMSGLAAARELTNLDYDVIVLEARNRIGGRVWTDQSLGAPLDLGGSWIHGVKGNPLTKLADEIGAKRVATDYDKSTLYDTDGEELSDKASDEIEAAFEDLEEQIVQWQDQLDDDLSLQAAIDKYLSNKRFSQDGMRRLLYAINTTIEHEYAADVKDLSLFWFDDAGEYPGGDVIFPGGYGQLTEYLSAGLDIRLGEVIQEIGYSTSGVRVKTRSGVYEAQKAVVTLPLGVLKGQDITFNPPLPEKKRKIIQKMGFGVLNKLYLRFEKVFWEKSSHLLGYISENKGEWCEWLNLAALTGAPVLLGFNAGTHGRAIEKLSDAEIVASAMKVLRRIYGSVPEPNGWLVTRWASDPLARGSYSSLAPGCTPDDYDTLAAPVGKTLFFAGEHTHKKHPATVHGAYLSGVRAAKELDDAT